MPVVFKNKNYADQDDQYDSGESTSTSIKPVNDGDSVNEGTFRRPSENLRLRTEELKRNINKYETILQSAGFLSYSYNEAVAPSTVIDSTVDIEWVEADGTFYVRPSASSVLTILGAVVPGMKYAIDRTAFNSFYTSEATAAFNPNLGLKSPGDSISLRVPMLSTADASASESNLVAANTSNPSIDDSVITSTLYDLLTDTAMPNNLAGADGDKALFKSPSKYRVKITVADSAFGTSLKSALKSAQSSGHPVVLQHDNTDYTLDTSTYSEGSSNLVVYLLEPNRAAFPFDTADPSNTKILVNGITYEGDGWSIDWSSIELEDVGAPPEEFLVPVASYTGTKIIVHGIGSVDADDVKNASGSIITLSNTGVSSIELGGAIESYESTFRLSNIILSGDTIKNDIQTGGDTDSLSIPISLDIPEIPTGRQYYLDSIDVVSNELSDLTKPVSINLTVRKSNVAVGALASLSADHISYNAVTGGSLLSNELINNPSTSSIGFYESTKNRTYSSTNTVTDSLVIETEEDRKRSFLLVDLVEDSADRTLLGSSFDLFFRLTFKTVHGTELPLLASYVPS